MNKIEKKEILKGREEIYLDDGLISIIIRKDFRNLGITFFTNDSCTIQLGYLPHKIGNMIAPHIHNKINRVVQKTNEVLFIKEGKVKVNFYSNDREYAGSEILNSGDFILLSDGGHGFEIMEETVMIEVKQGPYLGIDDKILIKEGM